MIKKIKIYILTFLKFKPSFICKHFGHDWDESDSFRQPCKRCTALRILMRKRFEVIGENPYSWQVYDIDDVELP